MVRALERESSFYSVMAADQAAYEAVRAELPDTEITRAHGTPELIEPKHSLRTRFPDIYYLDLTERQAVVLNSWSYFGGAMPDVLSPSQTALRARLKTQLRRSGPPPFQPLRDGADRHGYRERLLHWLDEF